jgi:hypothetical protein
MPEIPYTGVPDRTPELRPTPNLNVNPPEAAFGTNIAAATQHLGQVEEGAGKELFDRAYAIQELNVQSDALARMAKAQDGMNNAFVAFKEKRGQDAINAFPQFQQDLNKALDDNSEGLSPYGKVYYDRDMRTYRGKMLFNGSEHAADEQKSYFVSSAQARQSTAMKGMELNPDDVKGNEKLLDGIRSDSHDTSAALGEPPGSPQYIKREADAVNAAIISQLRGMGQTNPIGALKLFDQAKSKNEIYGEDAGRMYQWLKVQRDTIGARHNAGQVLNEAAGFNLGGRMLDEKGALAGLTGSEGGARFYNWSGADQWDQSHQNFGHPIGAYSVMSYALQGFLRQAGMGPMTEEEFKADHAAQDQLAWTMFNKYQQQFGSADAAAIAWFGGEGSVKANLAALSDGHTSGPEYLSRFHRGVVQGAGEADIATAARTVAKSQFPGDDDFADANENAALTQYNKEKQIRTDTNNANTQTLWGALINGVGPQHEIPTTPDELKLDPTAAQAWDSLTHDDPKAVQQFLNQMAKNAKGDVALTPEREQNWQKLAGLSVNDPKAFMDQTADVSKLDLPLSMKKQIIAWQRDIYKKADADPQMSHAMTYLQRTGILPASGLTKDQDPDGLNQFTGILHDIMSDYQMRNDKPMPDDEIEATATRLLQRTSTGYFGTSIGQGPQWFKSIDTVPEHERNLIIQNPIWQGAQPSDEQILKIYLATQYNNVVNPPKPPSK